MNIHDILCAAGLNKWSDLCKDGTCHIFMSNITTCKRFTLNLISALTSIKHIYFNINIIKQPTRITNRLEEYIAMKNKLGIQAQSNIEFVFFNCCLYNILMVFRISLAAY